MRGRRRPPARGEHVAAARERAREETWTHPKIGAPVCGSVNPRHAHGYTWRTSVARMGGEFLLGLNREVRQGAGVKAGDEVDVTVELDTAPRDVEVPEALAAALAADPQAKAAFDGMAFTHRKEYARWVAEAKREATRRRRAAQAVEMLRAGQTLS